MELSKNFTLKGLTRSSTATRLGIDNIPNEEEVKNLKVLCEKVLQPIREHYDVPIIPSSGFRCLELNRLLKSKDTSSHTRGEAADIEVPGVSNLDLAIWIKDNLEVDQVILEYYSETDPEAGWVHVSYRKGKNRKTVGTISKENGYVGGLPRTRESKSPRRSVEK